MRVGEILRRKRGDEVWGDEEGRDEDDGLGGERGLGDGLMWKGRDKKKALCGNRRPSNDCLPYENS